MHVFEPQEPTEIEPMERELQLMAKGTALRILYAGCESWVYRYWTYDSRYMAAIEGHRCSGLQLCFDTPGELLCMLREMGGQG